MAKMDIKEMAKRRAEEAKAAAEVDTVAGAQKNTVLGHGEMAKKEEETVSEAPDTVKKKEQSEEVADNTEKTNGENVVKHDESPEQKDKVKQHDNGAEKEVKEKAKKSSKKEESKSFKGMVPHEYARGSIKREHTLRIELTEEQDYALGQKVLNRKVSTKRAFVNMATDAFLEVKENYYDKLIRYADEKGKSLGTILNEIIPLYFKTNEATSDDSSNQEDDAVERESEEE